MRLMHCYVCDKRKSETDFALDKSRRLGRKSMCKKCHNQRRSEYKWQNKEIYQDRIRARNRVAVAVYQGQLRRLPCEVCAEAKSEAHHYLGYAKEHQLHVKWLCRTHHREADAKSNKPLTTN